VQAKLLKEPSDGHFTDGQPPGHLAVAQALLEPLLDKGMLAAWQLEGPTARLVGQQAGAAVLSVTCFPTSLGGDGVTKGSSDVKLRG